MSELLNHLHNLLRIERQEEYRYYQQYVLQAPLAERKQRGLCWFPLRLNHTDIGAGGQLHLHLQRPAQGGASQAFAVGGAVSLFAQQEGKTLGSMPGVVVALWPDAVKVAFSVDEPPDWLDEGRLGLDIVFDNTTYDQMERALQQVARAERNRLAHLRDVLLGHKAASFKPLSAVPPLPGLNQWQREAVAQVLAAQDVAIIHGPPGTGKTTTLVQAIKAVQHTEGQVLVSAPSNAAVDLLCLKLAAEGLRVLRLGNPARAGEAAQAYTLDEQMDKHSRAKELKKLRIQAQQYRDMAHKYKRNFGPAEREQRRLLFAEARQCLKEATDLEKFIADDLLHKAQAIVATLVGTAHPLLGQRQFGTVFIDEAAQALAPASLIPILRAERVVMAGDHCQLPPTVKSMEAARKGLDRSLLEHMLELHRDQVRVDTLLRRQYRMHERIMGFSNQMFYEGKLEADPSVAGHHLAPHLPPILFIDTAGCSFEEKRDEASGSIANPDEANLLWKHFLAFAENNSSETGEKITVGIIAPYKAQTLLLADQVAKWQAQQAAALPFEVEADTVDSFQGQERDVIYLSLTRTNDTQEIGFLKDTRRINVAMTRARKHLIIVGDSVTISAHPFYAQLLEYVEKKGTLASAWEFLDW